MDAINKKKKFRQTKLLMKIAREDGMTQEDINRMCRAGSQSVVSDWCRGVKLAPEHKLQELLQIYGSKVRKQSSKLYYRPTVNVEITQKLIDDLQEFGASLEVELDGEVIKVDGSGKSANVLGQGLIKKDMDDLKKKCRESGKKGWEKIFFPSYEYVRVEGPIVFQHTYKYHSADSKVKNHATYRVIVHDLQNGKFSRVMVRRGNDLGSSRWTWLHSQVEDGIWWFEDIQEYSLCELMDDIDAMSAAIYEHGFKIPSVNNGQREASPDQFRSEALVMPYAFRKALLNSGYPVDGILDQLSD